MRLTERFPSLPYVAPFATFMALLALGPHLPIGERALALLRVLVLTVVLIGFRGSKWPPFARSDLMVLMLRSMRAVILVPIVEELFWRTARPVQPGGILADGPALRERTRLDVGRGIGGRDCSTTSGCDAPRAWAIWCSPTRSPMRVCQPM